MVAVASVVPVESCRVRVAPETPEPADVRTEPVIGLGVALTARLSIRLRVLPMSTAAGSKVTPPTVHADRTCLPLCARTWLMKAVRILIAVLISPAMVAACAAESLAASALALPALSMHPATSSLPTTPEIPELLTITVTDTGDEWLTLAAVPITVSVKVVGVTKGDTRRVRIELVPPGGGVTELGLKVSDTPAGAPDALSVTAELKAPTELTVTEAEAVPPTSTVTGEIGPREKSEKSTTVTWKLPVLVFLARSIAVQVTVVAPIGNVEPDGGLQLTVKANGGLPGSVAETA